jgi:hypothetical protein
LAESAFTGGELSVMTATSPSCARVVTELISAMLRSLELLGRRRRNGRGGDKFKRLLQTPLDPSKSNVRGEIQAYCGARRVR